ncbi:phage tail assembly chaperone [Microvirga sp. GCM10011540]|uniref:phage tail assembly chaperone n=1 Tax=Microvirga sp. GCM10011540 TaxID=3317338 RepID=UPI00360BA3FF
MSEPQAFPWDDAMMFALSVLRWSPSAFWRATPRELIAAWEGLNGGRRAEPALGHDLMRLMAAFPDERGTEGSSANK